jgi:hypothetical protein
MKSSFFACVFCCFTIFSNAQSVLWGAPTELGYGQIISIDLLTCTETVIADNLPPGNFLDFVLMPNGTIYFLGSTQSGSTIVPAVSIPDPANPGTWLALAAIPGPPLGGGMLALNDSIILITTLDVISTFNINTNELTVLGSIPGFSGFGEMFLYNGQIYATQAGGGSYPNGTYILNLNPLSLTPSTISGGFLVGVCDQLIDILEYPVQEIDPVTGAANPLCDIYTSNVGGFISTAANPFGSSGPLCDCDTDSGTFSNSSQTITVCGNTPITLPYNNDPTLQADDGLVFVVTSNFILTNFPNNILAVFEDPIIPFQPGLFETGEYYYVYAIAANQLGAGIDYTDPCREISAPVLIRWDEAPAVTFTQNTQNCAPGGCQSIEVAFTGNAPFTLTYEVRINNVVQSSATQVFSSLSGSLQICPPAGYTGPVEVVSTLLLDAECSCGP